MTCSSKNRTVNQPRIDRTLTKDSSGYSSEIVNGKSILEWTSENLTNTRTMSPERESGDKLDRNVIGN